MDKVIKFFLIIFIFLAFMFLQACMDVAVSGAQAVYNRNSIQNFLNDHYINIKTNQAIFWKSDDFKESNISINTFNNNVLLTGQTPSPSLQKKAGDITKKIPGVDEVYNFIEISTPTSAIVQLSDSWITSKIQAQLIANNDINPDKIKIVTENGTVYLMGIVPPEQAEIATDIARTTSGVQNVVRLFLYVKITKKL